MFNIKKIRTILATKKDISKMEGFRSYIGKAVISKSGDSVGKIYDIAFSKSTMEGVVVVRKLSKFFIDKKFLNAVSDKTVMLSINPVVMLLGKQVFDADGKKLGKVAGLARKGSTNNFDALIVKKNLYSKQFKVPKADIKVSKKNIILNKVY